jgi:lipid-A-disaccharide synthase
MPGAAPRHIFISTGEVSGDLQGSRLVQALYQQAAAHHIPLDVCALGGDRMAAAGATLIANTSAIGSVGILEALPFLFSGLRIQAQVEQHLTQIPPDVVVLIDYFGVNLGIGRRIRRRFPQVPIVYYIAPQEWVWSLSPRNTQRIISLSDRILSIFQGEADYYQHHGASVEWVGHPLLDWADQAPRRSEARQQLGLAPDQPAIALLPASRRQEVHHLWPIMAAAAQRIQARVPDVQFYIPVSLPTYRDAIEQGVQQYGLRATILDGRLDNQAHQAIAAADVAITKSGTVNLETSLMNVPQVVLYRVHPVTAWIARHLLHFSIPYMSPTNLAVMKPVVPEFLQDAATPDAIAQATLDLLLNPARRQQMQQDYDQVRQALGEPGVSDRVAHRLLALMPPSA